MKSANGFDNVLWYVGAVDKNDDAIKQGRVRVRAYGIHSPDRNLVPTEDLPWAPVLNLGYGVNTPAPGDWVFGCFIDGRDAQHPIVLGIIPGQNLELPGGTGSSDDYLSIEALRQYGIPPLGKIMAGEDLETTQLVLQNAAKMAFGAAKTAQDLLNSTSLQETVNAAEQKLQEISKQFDTKKLTEVLDTGSITQALSSISDSIQSSDITSALGSLNPSEILNVSAFENVFNASDIQSIFETSNIGEVFNIGKLSETLASGTDLLNEIPIQDIGNALNSLDIGELANIGNITDTVDTALSAVAGAVSKIKKISAPSIEEPGVPAATEPHKNMVWKSRNSNSYIQIAEDEEFIVISHESGSHMQIDSSGNIKIKSFGDAHYYSEGHMMEATAGSKIVHIEGAYALECKNVTLQVNGDMNHTVKGDYNLNVGGKMSITAGESFELGAQRMSLAATSEHFNLSAAQKIKIDAGNNLSLKSGSDMFLTSGSTLHNVSSSGMFNTAGAGYNISAVGIFATANPIHLNSGDAPAVAATPTPETTKAPEIDTPVEREVTNISSEVETTVSQIGAFDSDESEEV